MSSNGRTADFESVNFGSSPNISTVELRSRGALEVIRLDLRMRQVKTMRYHVCPRCQNDWTSNNDWASNNGYGGFCCYACKVTYWSSDQRKGGDLLVIDGFLQKTDELAFDYQEGYCFYYPSASAMVDYPFVKLPMLPVTISVEQLKLYLTFS